MGKQKIFLNFKYMKAKKKRILYNVCLVVLIVIFIGSAGYLASYFLQSRKSESQFDTLKSMIDEPVQADEIVYVATEGDAEPGLEFVSIDGTLVQKRFASIYQKNHDFVGWLSIEDTHIDYPVMQTMEDEEYYIHRDFYGDYSAAGTLFADTESNIQKPSDNILIYGHNMKTGKMFHDLLKYENEDFYKSHRYIQFDTIYGNASYEVIAAFRTEILDEESEGFKYYRFFDAEDEADFHRFVSNCKGLTSYTIDTDASYGDSLITLSTCAYHTENGRFVVVAKKVNEAN